MQVLVLYYSKGGNTAKLARNIAEGVEAGGAEALVKNTSEVTMDDFKNEVADLLYHLLVVTMRKHL